MLTGVERTLVPLDALRRRVYRRFVPWLGPWIRDRPLRVAVHGASITIGAFLGAVLAPLWLLALGPLLLGVPHLLADVRYLVVRPGLHHRRTLWGPALLMLAASVCMDIRIGLLGVVGVALVARASWARRAVVGGLAAALLGASMLAFRPTGVALAHLHNAIAVLLWGLLATALHGPGGRARWTTAGAFFLGGMVILTGAVDSWIAEPWGLPGAQSLANHGASLAPGLDPVWAARWVVAFAYAQAVHYGLWLRVIPEDGRRRPSPRSWGASLIALRRDFGDPVLAGFVVLAVAIAAWGVVDVAAARAGYLRLALFHGPLELGVLALICTEGRGVLRP